MKKTTLGFLSMTMLALGACSTDVEDTVTTARYATCNLVSPQGEGESFASKGIYGFYFNMTKGVASVSTNDLKIDNMSYSFTTDTAAYRNYAYQEGELIRMKDLKGYLNNNRELPVNEANFDITSLFYVSNVPVPGYSTRPVSFPYVIAQYDAAGWSVATFQEDAAYHGTTLTMYQDSEGKPQSFENPDMLYRVIIDVDKKKADIIIYNAKFAAAMPKPLTAIILKGLEVTWKKGGYEIKGTDIVPEVVEGTSTTPNAQYAFNNFTFSTDGKAMVSAKVAYQVAGRFIGSFEGSYVADVVKN